MYYQDYRENLQNILDNIKGGQDSLNLGAIAIISLLDMAMVKEDGDDNDEEEDEQSEKDYEDANRDNANESDNKGIIEGDEEAKEDNDQDAATETIPESEENKEEKLETVEETVPEKSESEPIPEIKTVEDEYGVPTGHRAVIVERSLQGVRLYNANTNEYIGILNEEITRRFNIGNGSLIEVKPVEGRFAFVRTLHQVDEPEDNDVFHFAVVKRESAANTLYVDSNVGGDKLSDYNPTQNTYFIPTVVNKLTSSNGFVSEGDILDLAWKEDRPEEIRIRWVYPDTNLGSMPSKKLKEKKKEPAPNATTPKKGVPTPKNVKEDKHKTNESMTNIAFNLNGKKVTVVIGNEIRSTVVNSLISAHNGKGNVVDAFKFSNVDKFYKKALRHTDLVVMVQNLNKHATSKTLQKYVKKYKLRFAIADSAGLSSIERAIYRAYKGLPAYETTNQPVEYPMTE
ncbi:Putative uncharacterized protein [Lactobacillus equicursoris 66c]|uniref:DUF2325 domain-containing protein n=1 Tax=Lactobacillus equicursoris 66c TaxID=872326 RepID=K0NYA2_9LACO|nr:DUF2325 domain-containing protein [Lactobacillus equicursoris]CCK84625.1 Putative uncharacterized protein [Lactobacillus equicursoris 66c]